MKVILLPDLIRVIPFKNSYGLVDAYVDGYLWRIAALSYDDAIKYILDDLGVDNNQVFIL